MRREHSLTVHELDDFFILYCSVNRQKTDFIRSPMIPLPMPHKLRFNITPEVKNDIERAKQNMNMYVGCSCWCVSSTEEDEGHVNV